MGQIDSNDYKIKEDGTIVRNPSSSKITEMKRRLSSTDNGGKGNSDNGGKGKWGWLGLIVVAGIIIGGIIMNNQDNSDSYSSESSGYTQTEEWYSPSTTDGIDDEEETETEEVYSSSDTDTDTDVTESYYNFSGSGRITYKSNVYYFDMNLNVNGNRVDGRYIVTNGNNVWVDLSGTVNDNGKAVVYEYENGSSTGYYFDGYLNSSSFSGKYKTTQRNIIMDFYASSD